MGTPTTVLEARGVNNLEKGMASKSLVNLVLAVFVASVIGVTVAYPAYPSNVQEILDSENGENSAKIEKILSHFSPEEQDDNNKDIEKRSKSFSAWGGKRGGSQNFSAWGGKRGGQQFSAWGGKRGGGGQQFSAWGGKRSDWVDLVRTQLAEEALREMAQRRPNRVVRAGRASFSAWGGRK